MQKYELLSLIDIFDSGNRRLRIPDYQRGYSWETSQRKDLIEDFPFHDYTKAVLSRVLRWISAVLALLIIMSTDIYSILD